jgi:alkaline phosphatase D
MNTPRRRFLGGSAAALALGAGRRIARARSVQRITPRAREGLAIGDVTADRAIVWSRADRPGRLLVAWDTDERMRAPRVVAGAYALESSDFTARVDLAGLPPDQQIFVRVAFHDPDDERLSGVPIFGRFRSAPALARDVRFTWTGDTAGQGFGINPDFGGMRLYETMRRRAPDFFVHAGDTIYADGPLPAEKVVENGKVWRNVVTEAKSKVAETLAEFRGNYRYNLLDHNVLRFNAEVPQIWQWDDHEVLNNWYEAKDLTVQLDYTEKDVALLASRARRAFLEYAPLRLDAGALDRLYRRVPYGPLLDVFVVDVRSHRGPNSRNQQRERGPDTALLGDSQLAWLARDLRASRATWKVICAGMPLGLVVGDGSDARGRPFCENAANGSGPPRGRELEVAELLSFIKRERIENVVWITADVHYTAAHHYSPERARFRDFTPFWEFVAGPANAGSYGPNLTDDTFGIQVVFQKAPPEQGLSPFAGYQFFGQVDIDARDRSLTVSLVDIDDNTLFAKTLLPVSG